MGHQLELPAAERQGRQFVGEIQPGCTELLEGRSDQRLELTQTGNPSIQEAPFEQVEHLPAIAGAELQGCRPGVLLPPHLKGRC